MRDGFRRIRSLYQVFGPFLRPYSGRITLAYGALIASIMIGLAKPWPLKLMLDSVLLEKAPISQQVPFIPATVDSWDKQLLLTLLAVSLVIIVLIESTFGFLQRIWFSWAGHAATTDVMEHAFTHMHTLPRDAGQNRSGDLIMRITSDIKTLRDLLVNHVQKLGRYGLTFIGTLAVMFMLSWQLTLAALTVVPFIFTASYFFSLNIRSVTKRKRKKEGAVASIVQENLSSMKVIQAFAQEEAESARFRNKAQQTLDASIESARLGGAFTRSVRVLSTIGAAIVMLLGGRQVLEGQMSPGDLVVFAAYITELYTPIQNISELAVQFMESLVSGERVLDVLRTMPRIHDSRHATAAPRFRGEVRFVDVRFAYPGGPEALRGISFVVQPGETVAIVGPSGSGKSTVLNLILRFFDPAEGRILIDGEDIRQFSLKSLRNQMSVVLQEPVLFRRTVRENIAYGFPGAPDDQVIDAARAAHAHEFIESLPEGYDTVLDENGSNLSGGQRQRITLARAFLRDTPILVLDEPTSGLDSVTEAQFTDTLERLSHGRTTLVIAHRLSTVERAHIIIVLRDGVVVQQGTHRSLIGRPGLYRELFEAQQRDPESSFA